MTTSQYTPKTITLQLKGLLFGVARSYRPIIPKEFKTQNVYIIRDTEQTIIYIGSTSTGTRDRIKDHIEKGDALGVYIKSNFPVYLLWTVEIRKYQNRSDMLEAEKQLIKEFNPLLNKTRYKGFKA